MKVKRMEITNISRMIWLFSADRIESSESGGNSTHQTQLTGVLSTDAMGALAPSILGQSLAVSTRNSKVLNTPLQSHHCAT